MIISLEWISQYVDISNLDPDSIANKLTMSCAEVEQLQEKNRRVNGVVVGEIVAISKISAHDQLLSVLVDCGDGKLTTVCGAANVEIGAKSAFARLGSCLADGKYVSSARFGGVSSHGVLCSAKDLGFSEIHDGILDLPRSYKNGTHLNSLVPMRDTLIEIDNKSLTHRPDLWGHYGIAREIAAVFGRELLPLPSVATTEYDDLPAYELRVEDRRNCRCYACVEIDNLKVEPSPLYIQWRLHALGQRTINLPVDLTNYVMFELGQPMHAFDADKFSRIGVAPFEQEGAFMTLDGIERNLLPEDLIIWGDGRPVALAGIMGGINSEIEKQTTRLLLESANFKGSRIRRTASRLAVRTEASQRFEKDQPPANTIASIARYLHLAAECNPAQRVISRLTVAGDSDEKRRSIVLPLSYFNMKVGTVIPENSIVSILRSLGFSSSLKDHFLSVVPPTFRSREDVSLPEDIIEEVARVYGYDSIAPQMPDIAPQTILPDTRVRREHQIRKLLTTSHGFTEIHTHAWFDDRWLSSIGFEPKKSLVLKNPTTEYLGRLRTTLIPNLLAVVSQNSQYRDDIRLFEIGRTFSVAGDGKSIEKTHLGGMGSRQSRQKALQEHYCEVKAAIEDVFEIVIHESPSFRPLEDNHYPWQGVGECTDIILREKLVGNIGVLPSDSVRKIAPNAQIIWFEVDLTDIDAPLYPHMKLQEPSSYPGSCQDFSILCELSRGYRVLERILKQFRNPLVQSYEYVNMYQGSAIPKGYGSYTFRYWIGHSDRNLEREEIEAFLEQFIINLHKNGVRLRS